MRWLTLSLCLAAFSGCGTICDSTVNAEEEANTKGEPCGETVKVHDAETCNSNLNNCSPADINQIQLYQQCLAGLAVCTDDTKTSWGLSAAGCELQPVGKISGACAAGFQ